MTGVIVANPHRKSSVSPPKYPIQSDLFGAFPLPEGHITMGINRFPVFSGMFNLLFANRRARRIEPKKEENISL